MNQNIKKFIEKELKDLDVSKGSQAYELVMHNASEASEVMSREELKTYIESYLETLPSNLFNS